MLHALGPELYAVWVIGGVLIMVQSLFDLGVSAALVRFVAISAAHESRPAVLTVFWRSVVFYSFLSLVVTLPLCIFASQLSGILPSLHGQAQAQAAVLLRYAGVAFALTNLTLVLASLLQGVDRVDAAYRAQAIGWLLYVPLLVAGLRLGSSIHAIGIAWVSAYGFQVVLLGANAWFAVRKLPREKGPTPSLRQMLSLGGWWQLSAWADFATFQLPRLIGFLALSPSALISVDVAMRAAQLVVAPVFAAYPLVLPTAARLWTLQGVKGVRALLERWFVAGVTALTLFAVPFIPVEGSALTAWTGRSARSFGPVLDGAVLLGIVAHASTGLFSSVRLATGQIAPIVAYKKRQLIAAVVLIPPAALVGPVAVGLSLAVALFVPAFEFNRREAEYFGLELPARRSAFWRRFAIGLAIPLAGLSLVTAILRGTLPAWAVAATTLPLWVVVCAAATIWCWRYLSEEQPKGTHLPGTEVERATS